MTEHDPNPFQPGAEPGIDPVSQQARRPWRRVVAVAGAIGLIGSGAFAARQFAAPSGNTPTQAVQQFLAALGTNDVIGAMETLAPGERNVMIETVIPLVDQLKRLDVIDQTNDLRKLDAARISFVGQAFAEQPVRDDIISVRMTGGSTTMSADPGRLLGGVVKKSVEQFQQSLPQQQSKSEPFKEGTLTTVKRNGRWYVSLAYTAAEAARRSWGKPMPTAAESVKPTGAPTPEAAVANFMNTFGALDLRGALALMDPEEMAVLQDYAPLFLADAERAATSARQSFTLSFPKLGLTSKQVNGRTVVSITKWSADLTVTNKSDKVRLILEGDCVDATYNTKRAKRCGKDLPQLVTDLTGDPELSQLIKPLEESWAKQYRSMQSTPDSGGITVSQRNGTWFVSPVRTTMGTLVESLGKVKPGDLTTAGNTLEERLQAFFSNPLFGAGSSALGTTLGGMGGPGLAGSLPDATFSDPAFSDPAFSDPAASDPTLADPTVTDPTIGEDAVVFDDGLSSPEVTTTMDLEQQMAQIDAELKKLDELTADLTVPTLPS